MRGLTLLNAMYVLILCIVSYTAGAIDPQFCALSNLKGSSQQQSNPTAKQLSGEGSFEKWIIAFPDVRTQAFSYDQLKLKSGDKFRVSACGCVQTGGVAKTWKLFVNPSGPNSGHLYHGFVAVDLPVTGVPVRQIKIKNGVELNYVRIQDLMSVQATNPTFFLQARALESITVGYEDDHYGDNGYWRHDDGTQNQCKNVGGAVVEVDVLRGG